MDSWYGLHCGYIADAVAWRSPDLPTAYIDQDDANCPRCFASSALFASYGRSASDIKLVRMTQAEHLAVRAGVPFAHVAAALWAFRSLGDRAPLDGILFRRARQLNQWPMWATFWEDVNTLLPGDPTASPMGWVDELRNRLGITGISATNAPQEVLVEIYEIAVIPRVRRQSGVRALTIPTVLDGSLYDAFCPAPHAEPTGLSVDMESELMSPKREIVHPPIDLSGRVELRVGEITTTPPPIAPARKAHLYYIQLEMDRPDYGRNTDADLL